MKQSITLDRHIAEAMIEDFEGWASTMEMENEGQEHPWTEDMYAYARILRDKLAGRCD